MCFVASVALCHISVWRQSQVVEGCVRAWLWFANIREDGVEMGGQERGWGLGGGSQTQGSLCVFTEDS